MSARRFNVVFTGELVAGLSADTVRANLGKCLKLDVASDQMDRLFSSKDVIVEAGVSREQAETVQKAFADAGAICAITETSTNRTDDATDGSHHEQRIAGTLRVEGSERSSRRMDIKNLAAYFIIAVIAGHVLWVLHEVATTPIKRERIDAQTATKVAPKKAAANEYFIVNDSGFVERVKGDFLTALRESGISFVAYDMGDGKPHRRISVSGDFLVVTPLNYPDQETTGRLKNFSSSEMKCYGFAYQSSLHEGRHLLCVATSDFTRRAREYSSGNYYDFNARKGDVFHLDPSKRIDRFTNERSPYTIFSQLRLSQSGTLE